jgi:hypothetical protein
MLPAPMIAIFLFAIMLNLSLVLKQIASWFAVSR